MINSPKPTADLSKEFSSLFTHFYKSIEEADIFYLYNHKKNGVPGYIGAAGFSKATYALCLELLHNQNIDLVFFEQPDEGVACFEEIHQ